MKVLSFLTNWLENDGPVKFLQNWTEEDIWSAILSFLYQKFVDVKSSPESSNLWELSISVIKTGGFFIRILAKEVRKSHKLKN